MRKVLLASVALFGLAVAPVLAQTYQNKNTTGGSAGGSATSPYGGPSVGGNGSMSGSGTGGTTMNRSGTSTRDPEQAQVPSSRSGDTDRNDMNNSKAGNSARPYAPGQMKKNSE